ncbi:MAG: hypothetical protein H7A46_16130 [Verrucomicrobiales bacterium]|nr:hypothetical protein [Verrucomicrobiales bacterium]
MTASVPSKRRRWLRIGLLLLGVLLLLSSLIMTVGWFWWMKPFRNLGDPEWLERHTALAQWEETQTRIRRLRHFLHDDGWLIGQFGDRSWVERIIGRIAKGEDVSGCANGHVDVGLRLLANQSPGEEATDWLQWWQANKDKSQEEWMRDGFAEMGIHLGDQLDVTVTQSLLLVMGNTNLSLPEGLTYARRFNAFRWLRDHDFDPTELRWADFAEDDRDTAWLGLCRYSLWLMANPPPLYEGMYYPFLASPRLARKVNIAMTATALLGLGCLFWGRRLSHKQ